MHASVFMAPEPIIKQGRKVFLAGSVEMGAAEEWQARLTAALSQLPITILNPRRLDWDSSWEQRATNEQFSTQVNWELDGMDDADVIALYLARDAKSPITLLEFGLYARSGRMVVCCPEEFYRRGNVEIVCARLGVPLVETFDGFVEAILQRLQG